MDGPEDPKAEGWQSGSDDGFIGHVGPLWRKGSEHLFGLRAEPRHANLVGIVQGGVLMTIADRARGLLAWEATGQRPCVTIGFDTQFVGAGRIGNWIEVRGELVRLTRQLIFVRGLLSSDGSPLASCQGTWSILPDRTG